MAVRRDTAKWPQGVGWQRETPYRRGTNIDKLVAAGRYPSDIATAAGIQPVVSGRWQGTTAINNSKAQAAGSCTCRQ